MDSSEENLFKIYNTLTEIEASFRILKTDLSLRPLNHQTDDNVLAYINLGILAYQIVSTIRYQLKQKNITHDWSNIIRIMNTQKIATNSMINKKNQKIIIRNCSIPSVRHSGEVATSFRWYWPPIKFGLKNVKTWQNFSYIFIKFLTGQKQLAYYCSSLGLNKGN